MSLTLEEAKQLEYGDYLIADNGKRWKRSPDRIRVPLKHGLYAYDAITETDFPLGTCHLLTKEA